MANTLVEYILNSVETLLKASMSTQLTALQTAYADGVTLTAPTSNDYATYELLEIDQLPFIQILPDVSESETAGINWDIIDHNIIIVAHTAGWEGKVDYCAKRTYRFAEAIKNIILANRTPTNLIELWWTSVDYKPMATDGNVLKGEVWVHCTAKRRET